MTNESQELKAGDIRQEFGIVSKIAVEIDKLSVKFRFCLSILSILGGLFVAFLSGEYFYNKRNLVGAIFGCIGCLLGLGGLLLGLAPFPYGWLL